MKSILISIQPQWVEKILNGEKTIEIRKTAPKCELPCKVYIYCTRNRHLGLVVGGGTADLFRCCNCETAFIAGGYLANGNVVAEFTLNKITKHEKHYIDINGQVAYNFKTCDVKNAGFETDVLSLLDFDNFVEDYGNGKPLYAWHIENIKMYDKPKELKFNKPYPIKCGGHEVIDCFGCPKTNCQTRTISRPPQSWCYVEEL